MDKLGLQELLRYGYTGFLCTLVAAVIDREWTAKLAKDLGDVLSPFVALTVGMAVYLFFKTAFGDLFLWRLLHWLHGKVGNRFWEFIRWLHKKVGGDPEQTPTRCKVRYLEDTLNVFPGQGADAYAFVRDRLRKSHIRERFHIQHSEGYLFFVTAFVCGTALLAGWVGLLSDAVPTRVSAGLGIVAVFAFLAGLRHDIVLCRAECAAIRTLCEKKLRDKLLAGGFVREMEESNSETADD